MTFEERVNEDLDRFFGGSRVQLEYGSTPTGQKFATAITSRLWYAVRVYLDEDHSDLENAWSQPFLDPFLFKTQHATLDGAKKQVAKYREQLENGDYKAFLCGLPSAPDPDSVIFAFLSSAVRNLFRRDDATFETRDFSSAKIVKVVPSDWAEDPKNKKFKYLKRGDIVQTNFLWAANHEGIYIGNGKVIHVSGHGGGKAASVAREGQLLGDFVGPKGGTIRALVLRVRDLLDHFVGQAGGPIRVLVLRVRDLLDHFVDLLDHFVDQEGGPIRILVLRVRFRTPEEIVRQAEHYRDEGFRAGEYHLLEKNCQHFASLCAFGMEYSADLERLHSNIKMMAGDMISTFGVFILVVVSHSILYADIFSWGVVLTIFLTFKMRKTALAFVLSLPWFIMIDSALPASQLAILLTLFVPMYVLTFLIVCHFLNI